MSFIKKILFIFIFSKFISVKKNIKFDDLNFRKLDFSNYKQIKSFIFKKNFYKLQNKYVQNFEFLNFSSNLGGKIGINLSKKSIFGWFRLNKNKLNFPWSEDLTSKRLINLIYNYEFINSSSTEVETKILNKIILIHINRIRLDFTQKKLGDITSFDVLAYFLSNFIMNCISDRDIKFFNKFLVYQIDSLGMHRSYNILEHAKFINNLIEIRSIFLFFNFHISEKLEEVLLKMRSILNEYFHHDGTIPLFNGSNNNYTKAIYNSLNSDEYLKSRNFINTKNGIAFYSDKKMKLFLDVVQPNTDRICSNLSAGTLSFELSCLGEKIITNCGASESYGKNPEYLRYSAAHSTIILQNTNISEIKENNPHIKFPQEVKFDHNIEKNITIMEGSHNGYLKRFNKIVKRTLKIDEREIKLIGEDTIISKKLNKDRIFFHIRFHLVSGMSYNFTNNKKNIILKTKKNNMWIFKSDTELIIEDSILVDNNQINPTKQIVIKGIIIENKLTKKWSLEKI